MRPIRPASADTLKPISDAREHLRTARSLLRQAGTPQALRRVQATIRSTEGAVRHAQRRPIGRPCQP